MKKLLTIIVISAAACASAPAFADTAYGTSNNGAMQQQQPHQTYREVNTTNVPDTPIWRNSQFWHNEAERSGLPQFWQNVKGFFAKLNPGPALREQRDRYEANRAKNDANAVRANTAAQTNYNTTSNR
jgi:hypothetical protein